MPFILKFHETSVKEFKSLDSDTKHVFTKPMSLRVLLADKSVSIEKVFRAGLQDLGAEIKSVQNGLDVLKTAETYQPHIIFVDILMQKKNGYEITRELNQNQKTKDIPVVLMWSPFMELDQKEYQNCGAKAELEKPFEIEVMRQIFNSLVKESQNQNISEFLDFPEEEIKTDSTQEEQSLKTENKEDSQDFFPLSDQKNQEKEEDKQKPLDKENIFAESFEKFKPDKQDDESHSFFNLKVQEDSGATEISDEEDKQNLKQENRDDPNNREKERFDFSLGEPSSTEDFEESAKKPVFSFTEDSSDDLWEVQSLDKQDSQDRPSDKPITKDTEMEESGSQPGDSQTKDSQTDEKLKLQDFLYQPDSEDPPPDTRPSRGESTPDKLSSLSPEIHSVLEKAIKDQLPKIVEKVVREELEKIFKQEMALKKSNKK